MSRAKGRPSSYKAYSDYYDKVASDMAKKGYSMAAPKLNKSQWAEIHRAEINDRNVDVIQGKRKTVGNVNRDLVREQQWKLSRAQARARMDAAKRTGNKKKYKVFDIRSGNEDPIDWDMVKERRRSMKAAGVSDYAIKKNISQEFFGSE